LTRISINLLGIERKEALSRSGIPLDKGWLSALAIVIASVAIAFLANTLLSGWVSQAQAETETLAAKIKDLDAKLAEIKTLEAKRKNLQMEEKILLFVTGETYKWSYLLQEVRAVMPLDVVINDLKITAGGEFTLSGSAMDHRTVALFLRNLENSKMLSQSRLQSSIKTKDKTTFVISCKVKAG
jgi:type IV pilus assembly protein PilN